MEIIIILLLVTIAGLLWKIQLSPKVLASHSNDWLILRWHKIDPKTSLWDSGAPMYIEFVPIIGWEYCHGKTTPVTPRDIKVYERLNNHSGKYETIGYLIRDGVVYDLDDMRPSDFWSDLVESSIGSHKIEIYGNVPDCYRERLSQIITPPVQTQK